MHRMRPERRLRPSARAMAGLFVAAMMGAHVPGHAEELRSVKGLVNPESVVVGADGRIYVSEIGAFGKDGDGRILVIDASGAARPFATGLDDPKGLVARRGQLFVADKTRVMKIDAQGKVTEFAAASAFPQPPVFLNDLAFDARGELYVSDTGDLEKGGQGAIFRITPEGQVSLLVAEAQDPAIKSPNGLLFEPSGALLVADFFSGELLRIDMTTRRSTKVADGFGGGDGLARDPQGMLYVTDWKGGRAWKLDSKQAGTAPKLFERPFQAAADITLSGDGRFILVPDMKAGVLYWLPK